MKKTIYVFNDGEFKRKDNTLYFETEEGKKYIPVEDVKEIIVFGEVTLNKRFLEFLTQKEIILHFLNNYGYYTGSYYPREHLNSGYMILRQAEHYLDGEKRMVLAKCFVRGASANMLEVISYYANRGKEVQKQVEAISNLTERLEDSKAVDELMAIEGNIRDHYYQSFNAIIGKAEFDFQGRNRRPPRDRINALISFGNTLAYMAVLSEIYKTHLDPRIGYLHTTNFRRFTLNLDVAEIFKPILVDRVIFSLLGRNMLRAGHFENKTQSIIMNDKGRKIFVEEWENKLRTTIKHRQLGREVSYRRIIRMDLYKLEKHLMGEKGFKPFVSRW
ncbi:type I-B CRISPR-associated endonuclease Cas1b [Syntrophomonas wolfei]|mgnify:CR=1 FL=1|jgi:CRISPR-associated protein Cas1|uniref:type I-B CRISPR-associated endonuclease Cas1b n=1 Tax=Syntrophomonas wolfei TaxID=863 RepID=UPI0023F2B71A|nr:type I-B CRISPR-associated endonuclease Cas1b [Syntrophomonas wolfei]